MAIKVYEEKTIGKATNIQAGIKRDREKFLKDYQKGEVERDKKINKGLKSLGKWGEKRLKAPKKSKASRMVVVIREHKPEQIRSLYFNKEMEEARKSLFTK